ncbi:Thaumatin-like protein [Zostera marina]|uniref:Thaumatin-like protein n=1 Tax=Zostera marina TaxID=29655 RepID=A0A0K9PG50_ZOSMR|nr:Thaumatin-like protein [Zostera marina]
MASTTALFLFCLSSSFLAIASSDKSPPMNLTIVNNCPFTIWPAIQPNSGQAILQNGGFSLETLAFRSFVVPSHDWTGRIWARTGCSIDSKGKFECITGDCGDHVECGSRGGASPATLAQIQLYHSDDQKDLTSYGISLVDGFNIPVSLTPHQGRGHCPVVGCNIDLLATCPKSLQLKTIPGRGKEVVMGCRSGCGAFGTDELCCRNMYNSPKTCRASSYSNFFKTACPSAFTFAHDTPATAVDDCVSPRELKLIFCN